MEIKGKVLTLFPVKEGVGKTSGTPWKSRGRDWYGIGIMA